MTTMTIGRESGVAGEGTAFCRHTPVLVFVYVVLRRSKGRPHLCAHRSSVSVARAQYSAAGLLPYFRRCAGGVRRRRCARATQGGPCPENASTRGRPSATRAGLVLHTTELRLLYGAQMTQNAARHHRRRPLGARLYIFFSRCRPCVLLSPHITSLHT